MILLNFSHGLSSTEYSQIEIFAGRKISRLVVAHARFNEQQPFAPQAQALLATIDLTPTQWQSEPILVLLPSLNFIAALLLAELHGRMGYFPPTVRTRPVADSLPRRYEIAEILDLQLVRDRARQQR